MRSFAIVLLLALAATGIAASQARQATFVKPASCSDGLQAVGLTSPPRPIEIRTHYDSLSDSSIAVYARPNAVMIMRPSDGVNMITGMVHFAKQAPSELPPLELDLLVHSAAPRTPDERSLSFELDDSTHLAFGLAGAYPGAQVGGVGINEHIIAMLPPADALRVLRARKIRGLLGTTRFDVSDQDRDGLRALVMYVRCGAQ